MQEQSENSIPINVRANSLLDQMPFLKTDPNAPRDNQDSAKRAVVRGIFLPLAYFLLEHAMDTSKMQTPEEIVLAIVTHPSVGLEAEKQQTLLSEFGPGEYRDWRVIGFGITMQDDHQLLKLSQLVKDRLSVGARKELTKAELASY